MRDEPKSLQERIEAAAAVRCEGTVLERILPGYLADLLNDDIRDELLAALRAKDELAEALRKIAARQSGGVWDPQMEMIHEARAALAKAGLGEARRGTEG